jgi:lysozyme
MNDQQKAVGAVAAALAACALAMPVITHNEGLVLRGYRDPIGVATSCWGHTGPEVEVGKVYTLEQCQTLLAKDAVAHGLDIGNCLPAELPVKTRAAFISFGFNVGAVSFCRSTLAAKAKAGDLVGACNELPRWVNAGGKKLPGLVKRRDQEKALCLEGVAERGNVA